MRSESTFSPTAETTRSHGMSKYSPVPTGLRRPEASGSPSTIFSSVSLPSACLTGAASSTNSTPSSMASFQLVLIGGHVFLRAAIDDRCLRAHALCHAGGVHGGVARADHDDAAGQARLDLTLHVLHPADDANDVALDVKLAGLPRADGQQNVRIAPAFSARQRRGRARRGARRRYICASGRRPCRSPRRRCGRRE